MRKDLLKFIHRKHPETRVKLAQKAIDFKLYIPGWYMSKPMRDIINGTARDNDLIVCSYKGIPIATSVRENRLVMFYVTPTYRRNGIATDLFDMWKEVIADHQKLYAWTGEPQSVNFFNKIGLTVN